ncbi:MAG TPA: hypothetical protein VIG57_00550, partial [Candidatus Entotheonella sp.]
MIIVFSVDEAPVVDTNIGGAGATDSGTSTINVSYPASINAGDLLVLMIANKYPNNGPATPSGWSAPANNQASGGSGAAGSDSGNVYATVFTKEAVGTESGTLAVSIPSGNSSVGIMISIEKRAGSAWSVAATGGSDSTADTTWSVTGSADPGIQAGDSVFVVSASHRDDRSYSAETLTAAGVTFSTQAEVLESSTTNGDDCELIISSHAVASGSSSAAPVYTMTVGTGAAGASVILRVRQLEAPITLSLSPNIAASGANTTFQLSAPSGKTTADFDAGRIQDDENPADAVNIGDVGYTELEWSLTANDSAQYGDIYQFRLVTTDGTLATYSVTPEWTIAAGSNTYTWTGASDMATWEDGGNWSGASGYPNSAVHIAIINSTNHAIDTDGTITVADLIMTGTFTGSLTLDGTTTFTVEGTGLYIGSGITLITGGTLDINGTLNLYGTMDLSVNDSDLNIFGDITIDGTAGVVKGEGTVTFDGDLYYNDGVGGINLGRVVVDPTTTLVSDFTADSLTILANDMLVTDGYEITLLGSMTILGTLDATGGTDGSSTITVGGTWDMSAGNFYSAASTVIMNGTMAHSISSGSNDFENLYLNDGLVGYWKLDETTTTGSIADVSGYAHDGAGRGTGGSNNRPQPSTDTPTVNFANPRSIEFDNTDDYINVADNDDLTFGNGTTDSAFSVAFWVKLNDATSYGIFEKANEYRLNHAGSDNIEFILHDASSAGEIGIRTNGGYGPLTSQEGKWIHFAVTYDGSEAHTGMTMYLNGAAIATTSNNFGSYTAMENTGANLTVGLW